MAGNNRFKEILIRSGLALNMLGMNVPAISAQPKPALQAQTETSQQPHAPIVDKRTRHRKKLRHVYLDTTDVSTTEMRNYVSGDGYTPSFFHFQNNDRVVDFTEKELSAINWIAGSIYAEKGLAAPEVIISNNSGSETIRPIQNKNGNPSVTLSVEQTKSGDIIKIVDYIKQEADRYLNSINPADRKPVSGDPVYLPYESLVNASVNDSPDNTKKMYEAYSVKNLRALAKDTNASGAFVVIHPAGRMDMLVQDLDKAQEAFEGWQKKLGKEANNAMLIVDLDNFGERTSAYTISPAKDFHIVALTRDAMHNPEFSKSVSAYERHEFGHIFRREETKHGNPLKKAGLAAARAVIPPLRVLHQYNEEYGADAFKAESCNDPLVFAFENNFNAQKPERTKMESVTHSITTAVDMVIHPGRFDHPPNYKRIDRLQKGCKPGEDQYRSR